VRLECALLAIADRESIFDYIAPENLDAALALDELFERKAALLGAHPEAYWAAAMRLIFNGARLE
jgi:toxin ParE1/3/4